MEQSMTKSIMKRICPEKHDQKHNEESFFFMESLQNDPLSEAIFVSWVWDHIFESWSNLEVAVLIETFD